MIGYVEDYDPTAGWDEAEWERYYLAEMRCRADEIIKAEPGVLTVQDLIDRLSPREGVWNDRARRAALYSLGDGDIYLHGEPRRLWATSGVWHQGGE